MNRISKVFTIGVFALLSFASNAEFIEQDFLTQGDNQKLTDTTSNLTWLDLNVTNSQSYNDTLTRLNGDLSGFRLATELEITGLFDSLFPSFAGVSQEFFNTSNTQKVSEVSEFYNLLGGASDFLYGLYKDDLGVKKLLGVDIGLAWYQGIGNTINYAYWDDNIPVGHGVYLIEKEQTSVPTPTAIVLFMLAMAGFGLRKRQI